MPEVFVLLADYAAMVAAVVGSLFSIAISTLTGALSKMIPTIKIPLTNITIGGAWFAAAATDAENFLIGNTRPLWIHIATFFRAHEYIFNDIFGAVISALDHAFDYADHIVTKVIPDAIGDAKSWVSGQINSTVSAIAYGVATGTGQVGNAVQGVVAVALAAANHYTDQQFGDMKKYVDSQISTAEEIAAGALSTTKTDLTQAIGGLANTVASDYTQALAAAKADAAGALSTANQWILQATTTIEGIAQGDANTALQTAKGLVDQANDAIQSLTTTVASNLTAAEQYAQGQVTGGLQDVTDTLNGAAATIGGAVEAAAAPIAYGIAGVAAGAVTDANNALAEASDALNKGIAGVTSDITGQVGALNGDISTVQAGIAGAIAAALVTPLARIASLEECSVGVCEGSPNNFSSLLQAALGFAEVAGIGAFLEQAISNPAGTVTGFADLESTVYSQGSGLLDDILSL